MSDDHRKPLPLVPYLKLPASGPPQLVGLRCGACGAVFTDRRRRCAKCGGRETLREFRLAESGVLHAYSIVYRSLPGVPVPYVSAVVDMDGGGVLKSNLIHIEPDPSEIKVGMKVAVTYDVAPQRDRDGNRYMAFYFEPAGARP